MRRFRDILRKARTEKEFSLAQLASKTHTFKGYICGIERGQLNPPSPKMVRRLCDALGLNYQEMLALSTFEKLPKGLLYPYLQDVLAEALMDGKTEASGKRK